MADLQELIRRIEADPALRAALTVRLQRRRRAGDLVRVLLQELEALLAERASPRPTSPPSPPRKELA